MNFITYDPNTGRITGRFDVMAGLEEKYPNRVWITMAQFNASPALERTHKVNLSTKELEERIKVTLTTDKTSFQAGGTDSATITCRELTTEAAVYVGRERVVVSPSDSQIIITSELPRTIAVRFVSDDIHYGLDEFVIKAE